MIRCKRCGIDEQGVVQGLIRGLCSECTVHIKDRAQERGIYLRIPPKMKPPPRQRECLVDGISLFWWDRQWRINS